MLAERYVPKLACDPHKTLIRPSRDPHDPHTTLPRCQACKCIQSLCKVNTSAATERGFQQCSEVPAQQLPMTQAYSLRYCVIGRNLVLIPFCRLKEINSITNMPCYARMPVQYYSLREMADLGSTVLLICGKVTPQEALQVQHVSPCPNARGQRC